MKKSESIKNLGAALAQLGKQIENPKKSATNPFLKNKYAALPDILVYVRPLLSECGLSIVQTVTGGDGRVGISTLLLHTSGEWVEDTAEMPVESQKGLSAAQAAGSVITYLRRYALTAILNISGEDDNDGHMPSKPTTKQDPKPETANFGSSDISSADGDISEEKEQLRYKLDDALADGKITQAVHGTWVQNLSHASASTLPKMRDAILSCIK